MTYGQHLRELQQQRRALLRYMLRDRKHLTHAQQHKLAIEVVNLSKRIKEIASNSKIKRTDVVPTETFFINANLYL